MSTVKRSIVKTITYKLLTVTETIGMLLILTGDVALATGVGSIMFVVKICTYFIHERLWSLTDWGTQKVTDTGKILWDMERMLETHEEWMKHHEEKAKESNNERTNNKV